MLLVLISIELALIIVRLTEDKIKNEEKEEEHRSRRDTVGVFSNPLGDSYRKKKGLYVPIVPNSKMLDGDEEDEV